MSNFQKGDTVSFGRPGGEQTLGIVEKVNAKSLRLKSLEDRGRTGRGAVGTVWRVAPSLCTLVGRNGDPVSGKFSRRCSAPAELPKDELNLVIVALNKLTPDECRALQIYFRTGYVRA